jgi:hypothetical protein
VWKKVGQLMMLQYARPLWPSRCASVSPCHRVARRLEWKACSGITGRHKAQSRRVIPQSAARIATRVPAAPDDMSSSDDDDDQNRSRTKKRRVQRACDVCRKRKSACA